MTGLGVKSPLGLTAGELWQNVMAKESAVRVSDVLRSAAIGPTCSAACDAYEPEVYLTYRELRKLDRAVHLAVGAASDALEAAGIASIAAERIGIICGVSLGSVATWAAQALTLEHRGARRLSPHTVPRAMPSSAVGYLSMHFGIHGHGSAITTACAAGTSAIGEAARVIRDGRADAVLAGGCDALIDPLSIGLFAKMGALTRCSDPAVACRPFDARRDGFVMGEGAAFCVIESLASARRRRVAVLGEVLGYGTSLDGHHMTAPNPSGRGAIASMRTALADACVSPGDVASVNAHGTSTVLNDVAEARAVAAVMGSRRIPITANKAGLGHSIAGAGAVEAVLALLSLRHATVPPTANTTVVDPQIAGLVRVVTEAEPSADGPILSNSFGFGGHNASILLGSVDGRDA